MVVKASIVLLLLVGLAVGDNTSYLSGGADWTGECATGSSQSPIDIDATTDVSNSDDYKIVTSFAGFSGTNFKGGLDDDDNSEYEVKRADKAYFGSVTCYQPGTLLSATYSCDKIYFHAPAEHTVDGDRYDLEMVIDCDLNTSGVSGTSSYQKNLQLSILFDSGSSDDFLAGIIGASAADFSDLDSDGVHEDYWMYNGSETTDDCDQDVLHIISTHIKSANSDERDFFDKFWKDNALFAGGNGNNRSIKPLNSRIVYLVGDDDDDFAAVLSVFAAIAVFFF
jgi:carbonic anhydrase